MQASELEKAHCVPCKGKQHALEPGEVHKGLAALAGWELSEDGLGIRKEFRFPDFHRTMAFVNAVAWIAHIEDHHPDFKVSYPSCELFFSTHDVGGISLNDFICAAKVEHLFGSS